MPRKAARQFGKSLSPFGATTTQERIRLENAPDPQKDPECVMMKLWERENTLESHAGIVPLDLITHRCNDRCQRRYKNGKRFVQHHFSGNIKVRDQRLVAATVQWLATNCGRSFLGRFFEEIGYKLNYTKRVLQTTKTTT
jgi:hypothetical protein